MNAPTRVTLPGVPPGVNAIGGMWSRCAVREALAPWQAGLTDAFRGQELPACVDAVVTLGFSDRRRREAANWQPVVRRLLADALGDRLREVTVRFSRRQQAGTTISLAAAGGGGA